MRIAFVAPFTASVLKDWIPDLGLTSAPLGMGGIAVHEIVLAMIRRGYETHVVTLEPGWPRITTYRGQGIALHVVPRRSRGSSRSLWSNERQAIWAVLNEIDPDIVHAHLTNEFALAALDFSPDRTLVTAHDMPFPYLYYHFPRYLPRFIASTLVYSRVRWLSGVAPAVIDGARYSLNKAASTFIVPNIMPVKRARRALEKSTPYIVTIGEAGARKNVTAAIRAFGRVRASGAAYRLKVVGKGLGSSDAVATWAQSSGLDRGVDFLGPVSREDVLTLLANAALCVHPSRSEAHSMAIGEAMSLGIPVVAGRKSGGVAWQLDEGRAGCLVDINDPSDIARGIQEVLQNNKYRSEIIASALTRVEKYWSYEPITCAYEEIYHKIIQSGFGSWGSHA